MDTFIRYLTEQIEAGKTETEQLEKDGCQDDAVFAKVRTNIFEVCRSVTNALYSRPGAGVEAIRSQFERFQATWSASLGIAREHGETRNIVIEETKLQALADVVAHFQEKAK